MIKLLKRVNRLMIGFDLALASSTLVATDQTHHLLTGSYPSADAKRLLRRCAPIWFTFAAAHAVAARRGRSRDWWALMWLRATELLTDVIWANSPSIGPIRSKILRSAGLANLLLAAGFALLSGQKDKD